MPTDTRWLKEVTGQSQVPMSRGLNPYTHWEWEAETSAEEHVRRAQEGQQRMKTKQSKGGCPSRCDQGGHPEGGKPSAEHLELQETNEVDMGLERLFKAGGAAQASV